MVFLFRDFLCPSHSSVWTTVPASTATRFLGVVGNFPRIGAFFASRCGNIGMTFGNASSPANFDQFCVAQGGRWLKAFYKVTITVTGEGNTYTVQGWLRPNGDCLGPYFC